MQVADTNSSSPHPAAARAPTPPRVCEKAETEDEEEGRKTCTKSVECREEEKDLKDLHLGGDKQTQRQNSGKQPRKSHYISFILMLRWIWSFSNKQSLKSTTVCLQGPILRKYRYIHLFFFFQSNFSSKLHLPADAKRKSETFRSDVCFSCSVMCRKSTQSLKSGKRQADNSLLRVCIHS